MSHRALSPKTSVELVTEELWQRLSDAADEPEQADLLFLLSCLETALASLPHQKKLPVAGAAIAKIAQVYQQRSSRQLDEWEESHREGELEMADDLLDGLVQETMYLDLSELTRQPKRRQKRVKPKPNDSVVGAVEKETLLAVVETFEEQKRKALEVAHGEEVSLWSEAIAAFFEQHPQAISLPELRQVLGLPLVEVWMGLLLGGYELEQRGEFYQTGTILVRDLEVS